ncbi:hypothetical protein [Sulfolobus acidocaldarius]|uniref:Conserved protein n=4 Tax=Sulfolobus acidocaldarius TaxID=2285 RepID=Q4JCF0_SULAC|nr:hypothetical protein [Sulfolobus acidocaldarius]AAY79529.1 conserved protein [Sulfolobus acidocaldarius DSM 639]AGE70079.1 hypothetical protein SacN8_00490 [Sulfolobus acidocaldarius N8]AGE72354.1 hypothetical protein SacRon12I_00490 [Sulfolobus acidocaldarius Ron12/I]ALU29499.1 hypothetical protein ATY89_05755 [Sulfolobus acidocaldarius]ALU32229.1 hypothetical protein ATZ20_08780 [Sulfolobus acidocaldarius]
MLVPFVPTPPEVAREMLRCADANENDVVLDLGSGMGAILNVAKKEFKVKLAIGVELDKKLSFVSYQENNRDVEIICGDMISLAPVLLPRATILVSYLSTRTNEIIEPYILGYAKKGAKIVSHDFQFQKLDLVKVKRITAMGFFGPTEHTIYCYKI